jgi:ketosteroid isomerase-like protein
MKMALVVCLIWAGLGGTLRAADVGPGVAQEILALERGAMDGWRVGDPEPSLALLDPEITYFHDPVQERLRGLPAVRALFEPYRGRPLFDAYEIRDPEVQAAGEAAVLTYQLVTHRGATTDRWSSTEVFCKKQGRWRIVHAHWSRVQPPSPQP